MSKLEEKLKELGYHEKGTIYYIKDYGNLELAINIENDIVLKDFSCVNVKEISIYDKEMVYTITNAIKQAYSQLKADLKELKKYEISNQ